MMDVGELMQNLCRTFEPIATTRRNRLSCIETKPLVISASLEGILPVFTSFLIRSSYFFDDAHLYLEASTVEDGDQILLKLAIHLPKIFFNPNLLLSAHEQKILLLDNAPTHTTVVYVQLALEKSIEPAPPKAPEEAKAGDSKLESHYYVNNFERRVQSVTVDPLSVQQLRAVPQTQEQRFLEEVKRLIFQHIDSEFLTGEFLQNELGISKAQLFRRIKKLTNYSTSNYIRYVHIGKAQELLQTTQLPVGDIAFKMGFKEVSYFTHCFKEQTGYNPTEWRNKM